MDAVLRMAHLFIVFAITITFLFSSWLLLLLRRVFWCKNYRQAHLR